MVGMSRFLLWCWGRTLSTAFILKRCLSWVWVFKECQLIFQWGFCITTNTSILDENAFDAFKNIQGICFDVDDTLSTEGKLTQEAYAALWRLYRAGYQVVAVTGRASGWCDHMVRFWPVHAVLGENGAFSFWMKKGVRQTLLTPGGISQEQLLTQKLQLMKSVQEVFSEVLWASDQPYRTHDLAIDIGEGVPRWDSQDIERLMQLCQQKGAVVRLSSIHVNAWFGDYDKWKGFQFWLEQEAEQKKVDAWAYIGDSPNDEPMFKRFHCSVGVANVAAYLPSFKYPPQWITRKKSGSGFVEFVDFLEKVRGI